LARRDAARRGAVLAPFRAYFQRAASRPVQDSIFHVSRARIDTSPRLELRVKLHGERDEADQAKYAGFVKSRHALLVEVTMPAASRYLQFFLISFNFFVFFTFYILDTLFSSSFFF